MGWAIEKHHDRTRPEQIGQLSHFKFAGTTVHTANYRLEQIVSKHISILSVPGVEAPPVHHLAKSGKHPSVRKT